ncbi:MAG: class I SAM-dependent methyltransferase, partial [Planctomycetota bacterium]
IARARERLADLPNTEFVEGDGWTLAPIGDASVDLVFSHIVLQHTPRKVAASYFAEAHRVLRPGGHFVFQMPEAADDTPADPPEDDTFEMRFHHEPDLQQQLEQLGFDVRGCRRGRVESKKLAFNQLRMHAQKPGG